MMQKYTKEQLIGDAREYYVASEVSFKLGWIYRAQKWADLGIDGEIEILTQAWEATGRLLKVQVKTTNNSVVYLDKRHVEYWRLLDLPVVIIHVNPETRLTHWLSRAQLQKAGDNYKLDFSAAPEMSEESRTILDNMARIKLVDILSGLEKSADDRVDRLIGGRSPEIAALDPDWYNEVDKTLRYLVEIKTTCEVIAGFFDTATVDNTVKGIIGITNSLQRFASQVNRLYNLS